MSFYSWRPYVTVAQRRAEALRKIKKMRKNGVDIQPIEIEGRTIARSFWGKAWCSHLESFSDYENRLPRGRTYVRNGSVCHLEIKEGRIEAIVSGSELYKVSIGIKPLKTSIWQTIKQQCCGGIGSMLELLKGKLSDHVMAVVTDRERGLLPLPSEIKLSCSCPDWADMCKHVAAALYGVGSRLDSIPELLFTLRGVDAGELVGAGIVLPDMAPAGKMIAAERISDIFGIDIANDSDAGQEHIISAEKERPRRRKTAATKTVSCAPKNKGAAGTAASIANKQEPHFTGKSVMTMRKRLRLSIPQFARHLTVSPASVYKWERTAGNLNLQRRTMKELMELHQRIAP